MTFEDPNRLVMVLGKPARSSPSSQYPIQKNLRNDYIHETKVKLYLLTTSVLLVLLLGVALGMAPADIEEQPDSLLAKMTVAETSRTTSAIGRLTRWQPTDPNTPILPERPC